MIKIKNLNKLEKKLGYGHQVRLFSTMVAKEYVKQQLPDGPDVLIKKLIQR